MGYLEEYHKWRADDYFDNGTKVELKSIESDEKEIQDRFYKQLEFGQKINRLREKLGKQHPSQKSQII